MSPAAFATAISVLRRANLAPTRRRLPLTALVFSGPAIATTALDLCDRAAQAGLCLKPDDAKTILDELRTHGALSGRMGPQGLIAVPA